MLNFDFFFRSSQRQEETFPGAVQGPKQEKSLPSNPGSGLVAVDVRQANVQQEILLKIDTNTVKINLNVTFIKEMPTQYHTGCH